MRAAGAENLRVNVLVFEDAIFIRIQKYLRDFLETGLLRCTSHKL